MPYVDTEWAIVVEGTLVVGEVFANRWTIAETSPGASLNDAADAFHAFYTSWAGLCPITAFNAVSLTARNLVTGTVVSPAWTGIPGDETSDPLPPECALRISLTAAGGRHGGPFLSGCASTFTDSVGSLALVEATALRNALNGLMSDLVAADFALRLDSPSDTETKAITAARIGRVFDVIRRRRNQMPEGFLNATVVP